MECAGKKSSVPSEKKERSINQRKKRITPRDAEAISIHQELQLRDDIEDH
jgi:hypothetical protein